MSDYQGFGSTNNTEDQNSNGDDIRDIHTLTPTSVLPPLTLHPFESSLFMATSDGTSRDDYSNMSVTNNTLVVTGSVIGSIGFEYHGAIGEEYDVDDILHPSLSHVRGRNRREVVVSTRNVKKEVVESKIIAWKNAKISKITNRFKCEDAIIKGWESEKVQKATLKMKQIERKLDEKKARTMENMENEIAKAPQKAEEWRVSAESIRGTKMARVLEVANWMKAPGRSPVKNFF